jgi:hypothetical protein
MDIINLSRAELSVLMATTVQPTCVNIPEELIRCMPSYVRDRVRFVNCDESVCDITGLPMTRFDMEDELYQAPRSLEEKRELFRDIDKAFVSSRGKSQILKDYGVDVVYFDCTMGGE